MRMTSDELKEILKQPDYAKVNPNVSCKNIGSRQAPELEPAFIPDALGTPPLQKTSQPRFRVAVHSVRKRLLDEDNLSAKFLVDQLRYRRFIPDDNAPTTKIEVTQRQCGPGEAEHVEITVERL